MNPLRILFYTFFSLLMVFSSCDIINPAEEEPTYIKIDTFMLEVTDIDQGAPTHSITNCYISVGGYNMGIFQMPFTIPSLEKGLQTITIRPGIKLNGIAASRTDYPFFEPYIIDLELHGGEIHLIEPVTRYKDVCNFAWIEDFEDAGLSMIYADYSTTTIISQQEEVRSGRYSGAIFVNEEDSIFEAVTAKDYILPQNQSPALLEFDYFNNNGFEVGMYVVEDGATEWYGIAYLKPNPEWKRFYMDVGSYTTINQTADSFFMAFRVFHEPENNENGHVYLDNIKLIHFK